MSGLPIPDLVSLGKSLKDFMDYWKFFKDEKIRIVGPSSSSIKHGELGIEYHFFKEIIEGVVGAIIAYPPGLILKDVTQFVRHEWNRPMYVVGKNEPQDWYYNANDSIKKESFKQKFISFNFITSVEFSET